MAKYSDREKKILERFKNDPRVASILKEKPIRLFPKDFPDAIQFGQIFETQLPENWPDPYQERRMVLVLSDGAGSINPSQRDIKIAPISFEIANGMPMDILVHDPDVLIGIPFLIRLSDTQNMLEAQLENYYGKLPKSIAKEVIVNLTSTPSYQKVTEKQVRFWKREHRLTRYLRQPVLDVLNK